ncbi:MAG: hypothetical protein ED559_11480 [Phycisphaera sp.]|nr:MAG: hypothetical protein ED559_11480 [Phycisphaera sp.]
MTDTSQGDPFRDEASRVLEGYRSALLGVMRGVAAGGSQSRDLESALGLDRTLAWKVSSAASCSFPFDVARHIPGKSAIKILTKAGKRKGLSPEVLGRVESAYADYEQLVKVHAGDRATLEMMLCSYSERERKSVDRDYRKAGYRSNSYTLGVQAKIVYRTYILNMNESSDSMFDLVSLRGIVGLRRIRSNAPWIVHRQRIVDDQGTAIRLGGTRPIDETVGTEECDLTVPWMREFCTQPLPNVRRVYTDDERMHMEILEGRVGETGRSNYVLGEFVSGAGPSERSDNNNSVELALKADMPIERIMFDQIVHRALFSGMEPAVSVYSEMTGATAPKCSQEGRYALPIFDRVECLGAGLASVHVAEIPDYTAVLRRSFDSMGWNPDHFVAHRFTLEYPPIPSVIVLETPL